MEDTDDGRGGDNQNVREEHRQTDRIFIIPTFRSYLPFQGCPGRRTFHRVDNSAEHPGPPSQLKEYHFPAENFGVHRTQ